MSSSLLRSETISREEEAGKSPHVSPGGPTDFQYPQKLNAATELLEKAIGEGYAAQRCVVFAKGEWTYSELNTQAIRLAGLLAAQGAGRGSRVLLRGFNSPYLIAAWFAVLKLGAVAVTVLPAQRCQELAQIIGKAGVTHAVCDVAVSKDLLEAQTAAKCLSEILLYDANGPRVASMPNGSQPIATCDTNADDIALIAFTSGSTGEPKGCIHLHRHILAIADSFSKHILQPTAADLFCGTPPLGFTFGLGALIVFPLRARASTLLVETPGIAALAEAIERHRPTICFSAPTGYRGLSRLATNYDLQSLQKCVSAGEWLSNETRQMFFAATGRELIDGIGSTEMLHIFISASGQDIRPGAIGKPVPGYEARIVDENGEVVPSGKTGLLSVRGPTEGRYLNGPCSPSRASDGWTMTGDRFYQDEDGYFWFVARNDDMIVSAGYNIAGPEVERALLSHPAVSDCAVAGVADAERGQLVKAWIVPAADWADHPSLTEILTSHVMVSIAPYKRPRQFAFVDALPRTATGKLQRFRLR